MTSRNLPTLWSMQWTFPADSQRLLLCCKNRNVDSNKICNTTKNHSWILFLPIKVLFCIVTENLRHASQNHSFKNLQLLLLLSGNNPFLYACYSSALVFVPLSDHQFLQYLNSLTRILLLFVNWGTLPNGITILIECHLCQFHLDVNFIFVYVSTTFLLFFCLQWALSEWV